MLVKSNKESVWKKEETVVAADPEIRTYLVKTPPGVLSRNRNHLQKLPSPRQMVTGGPSSSSPSISDSLDAGDSKDIDSKEVADPQGAAFPSAPPSAPRNTRAAGVLYRIVLYCTVLYCIVSGLLRCQKTAPHHAFGQNFAYSS